MAMLGGEPMREVEAHAPGGAELLHAAGNVQERIVRVVAQVHGEARPRAALQPGLSGNVISFLVLGIAPDGNADLTNPEPVSFQ